MNHIDQNELREEISKTSKRIKNYFIETESSSLGVSFTIKDENNKVILKGKNLFASLSGGQVRLLMIGFVGGVFLPFIIGFLGILLYILRNPIIPPEVSVLLCLLTFPWAFGYTIFYNLIAFRFFVDLLIHSKMRMVFLLENLKVILE